MGGIEAGRVCVCAFPVSPFSSPGRSPFASDNNLFLADTNKNSNPDPTSILTATPTVPCKRQLPPGYDQRVVLYLYITSGEQRSAAFVINLARLFYVDSAASVLMVLSDGSFPVVCSGMGIRSPALVGGRKSNRGYSARISLPRGCGVQDILRHTGVCAGFGGRRMGDGTGAAEEGDWVRDQGGSDRGDVECSLCPLNKRGLGTPAI